MSPPDRSEADVARDLALVRAVLRGDASAEETFLARMACVPKIVVSRNRRLGRPLPPETLEDVIQDVLSAAWGKLERYDGRASLETWVYGFCYLELMKRLRPRHDRTESLDEAEAGGSTALESAPEPERMDLERVHGALESLAEEEGAVVRLKHFEDATFDQIGERLGISPNTAKTRYYRGLMKLRQRLGRSTAVRPGGGQP